MTPAPASASAHDVYDPDAVVPQNSPLLIPKKLSILSSSPPPVISSPPLCLCPSPRLGRAKASGPRSGRSRCRRGIQPSQGDANLISAMDNGRHPEIARMAGEKLLQSDSEEEYDSPDSRSSRGESPVELSAAPHEAEAPRPTREDDAGQLLSSGFQEPEADMVTKCQEGAERLIECEQEAAAATAEGDVLPGSPSDLQTLAGGALAALALGDRMPHSEHGRAAITVGNTLVEASRPSDPFHVVGLRHATAMRRDERPHPVIPAPYTTADHSSPRTGTFTSPALSLTGNGPGDLPPIQATFSKSHSNGGVALPSIRQHLGPIEALSPAAYPLSPTSISVPGMSRLPCITHATPPVSPHEFYARNPRSPSSILLPSSPYYSFPPNAMTHRPSIDYISASPQSTENSAPTPSTSTHSVADRMSLDGLAFSNPQDVGQYICKFDGCRAPPFQTQYLLNSHANVHSQARPHYCPVKGCPRSEGGKGFKRKNEMIRHGLVHESPGYVCPFCPDREHKYPRPDNLQRHVRVHHVDKHKDDPELRDVLSQRPDGPSRGRRRRGAPM